MQNSRRRGFSSFVIRSFLLVALVAAGCDKKADPAATTGVATGSAAASVAPAAPAVAKTPLRIAYSDWPGWSAYEIGIQKGWFKEAGVDTAFEWFEYSASMEAFTAGKVDAVMMTMGDALVTGAAGARSVAILINDYSNGNDMIVAKPGFATLKDLKGKRIGLEIGLVDHLLLLKGLEKAGMKESDVKLVNVLTHETAQSLASKDVDAIGAWQPSSGQALKAVAGSKAIFTSADVPGLIYDELNVNPKSLVERRADWVRVVKVWNRLQRWVSDPANHDEAIRIMASRAGVPPEEYAQFLPGTRLLSPEEALTRFESKDTLDSVYGSAKVADAFNVANKVYAQPQPVGEYIDGSLSKEALGK